MEKREVKVRRGMVILLWACAFFMGLTVLSSCENEDIDELLGAKTLTEVFQKEKTDTVVPQNDPTPEYYIVPVHEADSNVLVIADTVGERTSGVYLIQSGKAKLSLKLYKYDTEMKYKNLSVDYSNKNKTMSDPEAQNVNGHIKHVTRCTFPFEDGNIGYVDAESWQTVEKINGETHTFPYAKLTSFDVLSLNNVNKSSTRGTYVVDSCYTEASVKLHYVYEDTNVPAFDVVLNDTCFRRFLAEDDIDGWEYDNAKRKVLSSSTERCDFRKIGHMKSGETKYLDKSIILQYGINGDDEYELIVKGFGFGFNNTNGLSFGNTNMERVEGAWTVSRRYFGYGSVFTTPQGDKITTKYNGFSEGATYNDGDVKVEFPVLDMKISEGNTDVSSLASDDWYDKARFNNAINADYQGYTQSVSESVLLKKEAVRQTDEYWDQSSAKKTITLWNIHTSIDYVIVSSNGSEDRTTYVADFGWSFGPKSHWSVNAENNSYFTGSVSASVNGSQKSQNKDGATWNWVENSHSMTATVSVANGNQVDEWEGRTVNDISITRNGNTYSFGHDDYSLNDKGSKLGNPTSTETEDVYPYIHSLTFGIGGVEAEASVEGKITVAKPDNPTFFGKLKGMTCIVINNANHDDYMYGLLAHIEGGKVIPGIWNKSGEIQWFLGDEQQTSATNLNGCVYEHSTGKWVPVHGWDSPDLLQYDGMDGQNADNQSYATAIQWNWDEGHMVNGHPSVTTSRISFNMSNGVVSATDSYSGSSLGSWTYKQ